MDHLLGTFLFINPSSPFLPYSKIFSHLPLFIVALFLTSSIPNILLTSSILSSFVFSSRYRTRWCFPLPSSSNLKIKFHISLVFPHTLFLTSSTPLFSSPPSLLSPTSSFHFGIVLVVFFPVKTDLWESFNFLFICLSIFTFS